MALTRRMLKELGLEDESIEKIMAEHGKVMEGMTTKAQAEEDRKKALEDFAQKWEEEHKPVKVEDSEAYKALEKKYSDLQLDINLKSAKVKDKYRDFVKSKLSTEVPFDEGIKAIKEEYSEFFDDEPKTEPLKKPALGGNFKTQGEGGESEAEKFKKAFESAFRR